MVSVVLAALLWLVVSGEQTVERALRIPLEFTNLPPQLELVGDAAGAWWTCVCADRQER